MRLKVVPLLKSISGPEKFLLLVLLIFGSIACLSIPISAGYDEETHIVRAWQMAHLYFIPNEQLGAKLPFPALYWELSYRRQPIVEAVQPGLWSKYGSLRMDAHDYVYASVETRSVYSPLLLLPQALTLRYLGLSLQLPALFVYYACRFAGLLSYLILCWLALRSLPCGKWLLAVLMLSPMALFQASTINTDSISNGIGFLFLGASLAFASRDQISWKSWWILLGLIALLFLGKVNLVFLVLLPFLLIRPSRFQMKYGYILLIGAALVLFIIEVAGWNVVAYSHFTRALEGADPGQQLRYILSAPLQFIRIIANDIWTNTPAYMQGWVGVYGYNYFPIPSLTYLLYPLAVIAALVLAMNEIPPLSAQVDSASASIKPDVPASPEPRAHEARHLMQQPWTRAVLVFLFIAGWLLTIVSLYVAFTPVRSQFVGGVQGRYFTPVIPLLLLAFVGLSSHASFPQVHVVARRLLPKQSPSQPLMQSPFAKQSRLSLSLRALFAKQSPSRPLLSERSGDPALAGPAHHAKQSRLGLSLRALFAKQSPPSTSLSERSGDPALAGRAPLAKQSPPLRDLRSLSLITAFLALSALLLYVGGLILSYHVPCGSEYYRFGLCYQPEYKNWAPQEFSSAPLSPALTLTQEIVPACDGMQQVLVWVNSPGTDPAGTTQVTLRAPQQEKDLIRRTFKNADIPEGGWLQLDFLPEWQSARNLYLLTLSSSSPTGIQVGYSAKSEYMKGKLLENGSPREQDMIFQYGCLAGLQRFRMGK